jgi:hypothetical protein
MTLLKRGLALAASCLLLAHAAHATTVRVHYAAGKEGIRIRADKGAAGWSKGVDATLADGPLNVWTYTWPDQLGEIAMKPTLGEDKVSIGGVYKLAAGATVDIYPFFGAPFGKVSILKYFPSPELNNKRSLRIYLPASYEENPPSAIRCCTCRTARTCSMRRRPPSASNGASTKPSTAWWRPA